MISSTPTWIVALSAHSFGPGSTRKYQDARPIGMPAKTPMDTGNRLSCLSRLGSSTVAAPGLLGVQA